MRINNDIYTHYLTKLSFDIYQTIKSILRIHTITYFIKRDMQEECVKKYKKNGFVLCSITIYFQTTSYEKAFFKQSIENFFF